MGDDEGRAAPHRRVDRPLDLALGLSVEGAGRLVEDHDRRVLEEGAGDRQALALAAREVAPALADHGLEAVRGAPHEVHRLRRVERPFHLGRGRVRLADAQVLLDRAGEDERFLEHHADVLAQRFERHRADVAPVDRHLAPGRIEHPVQRLSVVVLPDPVAPC